MLRIQKQLRRQLQNNKKRLANRQGFTLIEAMIVVVVIGLLAAGGIWANANLIGKSVEGVAESDLKGIHAASIDHFTTFNRFPSAIVASGTAASATNMPFEASPGNTITIATGSTTTQVTYSLANTKLTGACTITVRTSGTARPVCP